MRRNRYLFLSVLLGLLLYTPPAGAVWVNLTKEQIEEAIRYGRENKKADYLEFFKNWRVDLGYGKGSARVITEFSQVAFLAKNLTFEYIKPDQQDVEKAVEELKDRLAFGASLYGETLEFAKDCHAMLRIGRYSLRPIEERHGKTAEPTRDWPKAPAYRAICYYYFDLHDVDLNGAVTLEVTLPDKSKVAFPFNLSKIK